MKKILYILIVLMSVGVVRAELKQQEHRDQNDLINSLQVLSDGTLEELAVKIQETSDGNLSRSEIVEILGGYFDKSYQLSEPALVVLSAFIVGLGLVACVEVMMKIKNRKKQRAL